MTAPKNGVRLALRGAVAGAPRCFLLEARINRVGSAPDNEVRLDFHGVSRRHARIVVDDDDVTIEDLASKNGTFVNGARSWREPLRLGDEVGFGPVRLVLEELPGPSGRLAIAIPPSRYGALAPDRDTSLVDEEDRARPVAEAARLVFPDGYVPGTSAAMRAVYRQLESVAPSRLPVLVEGESGAGKEWIARIVHASSPRARGPFVALNCTAIPATLVEAELFGIAPGVATGVAPRPGRFRLADGGTLFLDEIGDLAAEVQPKLLRALEEGEIQPLGEEPRPIDVRIVAATNSRLDRRVADGDFRADLYYRLAGGRVRAPALRNRREDIPELVEEFLRRAALRAVVVVRGVTEAALDRLLAYPWPGNVRELKHEVERLAHACPDGQAIDVGLLSERIAGTGSRRLDPAGAAAEPGDERRNLNLRTEVEEVERKLIREALEQTEGNQTQAARLLGITRNGLALKMARLGIRRP